MPRMIRFLGPAETISQFELVEKVQEILCSDKTEVISMDEKLWPRFANAISDAESELGLILNTYEEEWVEGEENLQRFKAICLNALGKDKSIDPYLKKVSEMAGRLVKIQAPLVIHT